METLIPTLLQRLLLVKQVKGFKKLHSKVYKEVKVIVRYEVV